jgi:hypothetical protein
MVSIGVSLIRATLFTLLLVLLDLVLVLVVGIQALKG